MPMSLPTVFAETDEPNAVIYRLVHEVIPESALEALGIDAEFCRSTLGESSGKGAPVTCFTASARNELQVDGRKLVGSAQRRTRQVCCSTAPFPSPESTRSSVGFSPGVAGKLRLRPCGRWKGKTVSLQEVLGYIPRYGTLVGLMRDAFFRLNGFEMVMLERHELEDFLDCGPVTSNS